MAAAGNSAKNTDTTPDYPSDFGLPNVLTIGATDQNDVRAWFSNYGKQSVDLAAPGTNIYSTWPGGIYRFSEGTSMAAPHVTGVSARQGGLPVRERSRPEGTDPPYGSTRTPRSPG